MRQAFFFTAIKFTYDSRATTLSSFTRFNRGDLCTWTLHLSVQSSIYGGHCCCISRCSRGSRRKRDGGVAHLPPTFGRLTRCSGILVNHNGPRMSLKNSGTNRGECIVPRFHHVLRYFSFSCQWMYNRILNCLITEKSDNQIFRDRTTEIAPYITRVSIIFLLVFLDFPSRRIRHFCSNSQG